MKQYVFDALLLGGRSGAFRDGRLSTRERCGAAFLGGAERGTGSPGGCGYALSRRQVGDLRVCAAWGLRFVGEGGSGVRRGSFGRFGQVGEGGAVDVLGDVQALGGAAAEFGDVADESDGAVVGA